MMTVVYKINTDTLAKTKGSILKILTYYSIFSYPLSRAEIMKYLPPGSCTDAFDDALEQLKNDGTIYRLAEFYSTYHEEKWVKRRREGNLRAAELLPKAMKIGRFLGRFPFVKGVAISGSLSKMFADEDADIDFFIITKANRLWIARTIMHVFKKLTFLLGKQHYYCMNYYIDEKMLKLEEQDIYTAMETITLVPVYGSSLYDFFEANDWVSEWFAEYRKKYSFRNKLRIDSGSGGLLEWLLDNKMGALLDSYLQKLTTRRWQRKKYLKLLNAEGREMELQTGRHFARSNPGMFKETLLSIYNEKINKLKKEMPGYF